MKTFIHTLALLIFSGCSTVAVPLVDATPVPAERIFEPALLAAGQHNAAFVRDPGAWGSLCPFDIYVDNVKVFYHEHCRQRRCRHRAHRRNLGT